MRLRPSTLLFGWVAVRPDPPKSLEPRKLRMKEALPDLHAGGPGPTRRTVVLAAAVALGAAFPDRQERPPPAALSGSALDAPASRRPVDPGPPTRVVCVKSARVTA